MRKLFPENTFVPVKTGTSLRLVIAEAPGETEATLGEPLIGTSGRWFDNMCKKAGIKREALWLTNVIQCRPPDNVFPTDKEATYISKSDAYAAVEQCVRNHVMPLLKARPWQRIDILGDKPLRFILGKSQGKGDGIYKWRGSPLAVPGIGHDRPIAVPTIHPAAIARDQTMLPVVINDLMKSAKVPPENYNLYPSLADVQNFKATRFAFDIETMGRNEDGNWSTDIRMVGLCASDWTALVVPFTGAYIPELQRIFANAEEVIGHNSIGFDAPLLAKNGVNIPSTCHHWDTMLAHHLRFPDLGGDTKSGAGHNLEFLASQLTNLPAWKHLKCNNEQLYNARDVAATWACFQQLKPLCEQAGLVKLHDLLSTPLVKICNLMKEAGIKLDPAHLEKVRADILADIAKENAKLPQCLQTTYKTVNKRKPAPEGYLSPKTGKPIKFMTEPVQEEVCPWRSTKKKSEWLYDILHLEVQLDPETGNPSTGKIALDKLVNKCKKSKDEFLLHAVEQIKALKKINALDELNTTFCKEELATIGYQHANFNVHGTSSGRLSSSEPNMQNVPEYARYIYVPSQPGWSLIDCDYGQLENRLTAYLASDHERLARLNQPDFSEHKYAASMFFDIPYAEVVKDNSKDAPYGKAKRIVHGTNYLMGYRKIAKMYDMETKETKDLQAKWKNAIYPSVKWMYERGDEAKKVGFLTNPFERKRWFWCTAPGTRVLTADLTWVPVETLKVGDELVGFDEDLTSKKGIPAYRRSTVTKSEVIENAPRFRVVTDKGAVIATPNHGWAVRLKFGGRYSHRWIPTEYLQEGDSIIWFGKPWETEKSWDAAWLSGFLDGEGWVGKSGRGDINLSQRPGDTLDRALKICSDLGIYTTKPRPTKTSATNTRLTVDSPRSALEILGRLQPVRLKKNATNLWENRAMWGNTTRHEVAKVLRVEPVEDGPVIAISTTTKTLITEGLCSHNTESAMTEAASFLPQSTGADIVLRAMLALMYERINWPLDKVLQLVQHAEPLPPPARLLLQVHDSLVLECPDEMVPEICAVLKRVLEQPWPELGGFSIPVSFKVSKSSWGEAEDYKVE